MRFSGYDILFTKFFFILTGVFQISSLLDIIVDKDSLQGAKKVFYRDQKTTRLCRLSQEVDEEWVNEQLALYEQKQLEIQQQQQQQYCMNLWR